MKSLRSSFIRLSAVAKALSALSSVPLVRSAASLMEPNAPVASTSVTSAVSDRASNRVVNAAISRAALPTSSDSSSNSAKVRSSRPDALARLPSNSFTASVFSSLTTPCRFSSRPMAFSINCGAPSTTDCRALFSVVISPNCCKAAASAVPPDNATKLTPVTPCPCSFAIVSVFTGVSAPTSIRTRTSDGFSSSSSSITTCPTGKPL
mmetsp:Transcript_29374/g.57313  ORF Transcript_29374/g.57313 Transcript_29374/m.57313 type:complete len:207 (+) Transcript_29374:347-967(+)